MDKFLYSNRLMALLFILIKENKSMPPRKAKNDDESFQIQSQSEQSVAMNYSVISYKDRIKLIEMVCLEKQQILHAASFLNIRVSTAKYILRCFRKEGKILKKNCQMTIEQKEFNDEIMMLKSKIDQMNKEKQKKRVIKAKRQEKKSQSTVIIDKVQKQPSIESKEKLQEKQQEKEKEKEQKNAPANQGDGIKNTGLWETNQNMIYFFFYNPFII